MIVPFAGYDYTWKTSSSTTGSPTNYPARHSVNHQYTFMGVYKYPCSGTLTRPASTLVFGPPASK